MPEKVHELAKELKITSKELLAKLKSLKVSAKSHLASLTADEVKLIKGSLKGGAPLKNAMAAKSSVTAALSVKSKPVIPPKIERPHEASSIESAKKELLLQRTKAAAVIKKPISPAFTPATQVLRKPSSTPPPKPKISHTETKRPHASPAAALGAQPAFSSVDKQESAETKRIKKIEVQTPISVKDLADKFVLKPSDLIQRLIKLNIFATINQSISFEVAAKIGLDLGFELEKPPLSVQETTEPETKTSPKDKARLVKRAPIVTFMGHVDHGKTSLLDAIRKTKVASKEAGGITQHIGAYEVFLPNGAVPFLDAPGHEAFTAMRARGARATDVVVLVVAADDGVMPQTIEAIDHAKAAGVSILVAINKVDLPSANPERVKKGLMELGLMSEDWGGKTVMIPVSAKTGEGIDQLLEMLALESDLLELRSDPTALAEGVVVEAELAAASGVLATLLVQNGTLRVGDAVIVGNYSCKVRAMINDRGQRVKEAPPSMPVEILGLPGIPKAGDRFYAVENEQTAKDILEKQKAETKEAPLGIHITLEHLLEDIKAGKAEELKLIIKSDVQGSVEALRATLGKIQSKNVRLNIIHSGIGDISESDVMLAAASNAVVIGFHVGIVGTAKELGEKEQVDVRFYEIIYEVKTAIEKAMEGLLQPELKEIFVGMAEVRQVFKVSKKGMIAGCTVQKGKIVRNLTCRVVRNGKKVYQGKIESLKRFKDDAKEVLEGFECGIGVSGFDEILAGDRIEVFEIQEKARKLE